MLIFSSLDKSCYRGNSLFRLLVVLSLNWERALPSSQQNGHIYIVDYKELEGIPRSGQDKGEDELCYAAESLGLFYVTKSGDLVPIAIQFFQEPSETNPIWTPNDAKYDWLLAKMWLRNADHQVHQVKWLTSQGMRCVTYRREREMDRHLRINSKNTIDILLPLQLLN